MLVMAEGDAALLVVSRPSEREDFAGPAPLGEPLGLDLPAAWRVALRACPYCVAASDGERAACLPCEGTGDLLGVMLLDAYQRGRDHVLARLREVERSRRVAVTRLREEEPSIRVLKEAMGVW
jgi:hypothetical protein